MAQKYLIYVTDGAFARALRTDSEETDADGHIVEKLHAVGVPITYAPMTGYVGEGGDSGTATWAKIKASIALGLALGLHDEVSWHSKDWNGDTSYPNTLPSNPILDDRQLAESAVTSRVNDCIAALTAQTLWPHTTWRAACLQNTIANPLGMRAVLPAYAGTAGAGGLPSSETGTSGINTYPANFAAWWDVIRVGVAGTPANTSAAAYVGLTNLLSATGALSRVPKGILVAYAHDSGDTLHAGDINALQMGHLCTLINTARSAGWLQPVTYWQLANAAKFVSAVTYTQSSVQYVVVRFDQTLASGTVSAAGWNVGGDAVLDAGTVFGGYYVRFPIMSGSPGATISLIHPVPNTAPLLDSAGNVVLGFYAETLSAADLPVCQSVQYIGGKIVVRLDKELVQTLTGSTDWAAVVPSASSVLACRGLVFV